jgi:tetratricopeptide (TPR) repeat protein
MKTISLHPVPLRILFLLAVVAGLGALSWMVARTAVGDSVMTFVERNPNLSSQARLEGADAAVSSAGRDPLMHLGRGGVYLAAANEEQNEAQLATALAELRTAAAMTPEDYRAWMALGRALDRGGATAEAKAALERAVSLAPRHFDPRWTLANHLLRAGERDAAFDEFRQALAARPAALPLVFDYAWDAFQGDGRALAAAIAPASESKAQLIALLVARNKFADAVAVWRATPQRSEADVQQVSSALFNTKQMAAAYEVWSSVPNSDRPLPDADSLLANGDFEKPLTLNSTVPFLTWIIQPIGGIKASPDRKEPRSGRQSLLLSFAVGGNIPFTAVSQTVPAKSATSYLLSYAVRTEELKSLSMPFIEVVDAADATRFRAAAPLSSGTKDWKPQEINFTTDAKTEAVTVRIQRQPCIEAPCPVNGRAWFDVFKLKEAGR